MKWDIEILKMVILYQLTPIIPVHFRIAYAEGWEEAEYEAILSQKIIAHKAKKVNLVIVK